MKKVFFYNFPKIKWWQEIALMFLPTISLVEMGKDGKMFEAKAKKWRNTIYVVGIKTKK